MPLGSTVRVGASVQCGIDSWPSGRAAQSGSGPSSLLSPPKDSEPPKPLLSGGRLPFGSIAKLAEGYSHLLVASTTFGKDVAPRVAALLGVAQISDLMSVESAHVFKRPVYAGNAIITVEAPSDRSSSMAASSLRLNGHSASICLDSRGRRSAAMAVVVVVPPSIPGSAIPVSFTTAMARSISSEGRSGRTPWLWTFSPNVQYKPAWAKGLYIQLTALNLFNNDTPTFVWERAEGINTSGKVRTTYYNYKLPKYFNTPRYVRLQVEYDFNL